MTVIIFLLEDKTLLLDLEMKTRLNLLVFIYWLISILHRRAQCCTIRFKFHGTELQAADSSYWTGTGYTKEACEANCASDVSCYGYMYNSHDLRCTKSAKTDYEDNEYCTTCSFSSKQCGTDCPSTYTDFGAYKTSEESYAYFDISISDCKVRCFSDVRCLGFGYNSATSRCYLSEYNSPDSAEECPTCTFSRQECVASFDVTTTAYSELTSDTTSSDTVGITYGIAESTGFSIQETDVSTLTSLSTSTEVLTSTGALTSTSKTSSTQVSTNESTELGVLTLTDVSTITIASTLTGLSLPKTASLSTDEPTSKGASTLKAESMSTSESTLTDVSTLRGLSTSTSESTTPTSISTLTGATSSRASTSTDSSTARAESTKIVSSTSTGELKSTGDTTSGSSQSTGSFTSTGSSTSTGESTSTVVSMSDLSMLTGVSSTGVSTSTALVLPVEAITIPERLSSVSMYFPANDIVNNASTLCLCRCVYENSTSLQERITAWKDDLKLKTQELSSFKRRMTCANDARHTSKAIGGGGIFIISFIMSLIIVPDLLTIIMRTIRNIRKYKESCESEHDYKTELTTLG